MQRLENKSVGTHSAGEWDKPTFSAVLQRGNLALERLHLHGEGAAQITELAEILQLGLFGGNAGGQSRGGLGLAAPWKHGRWSRRVRHDRNVARFY